MTNEEAINVIRKTRENDNCNNCAIEYECCGNKCLDADDIAINAIQENTKLKAENERLKAELEQSIKLPYRLLDKVWYLNDNDSPRELTIGRISFSRNGIYLENAYGIIVRADATFHTREEAEQLLKGKVEE